MCFSLDDSERGSDRLASAALLFTPLTSGFGAWPGTCRHSFYFIAYVIGSKFPLIGRNLTFQGVLVLSSLRPKHS